MLDSLAEAGLDIGCVGPSGSKWTIPNRNARMAIIVAGASENAAKKKGRGGTITRLHLTEVAFYEFADVTLNGLLECVPKASQGSEIVIESTPNGVGGWFFEQVQAATSKSNGYTIHFFPWWEQDEYREPLEEGEVLEPRTDAERYCVEQGIDQEQLKWYRQKVAQKGQDLVDQEYARDAFTCFLASGRGFFDRVRVNELLVHAVAGPTPIETAPISWDGASAELRIWHPLEDGRSYVIAADVSEGLGRLPDERESDGRRKGKGQKHDRAAGGVFERGTGRHMATVWGYMRPHVLARAIAGLGERYNWAEIAVERNNHGHACLRALNAEQEYPAIFEDNDGREGWVTSPPSRAAALDAFEGAVRGQQWRSPDIELLGEMLTFIVNEQGKAEAAKGTHDDLVIMAAIAWDVLSRPESHFGMGDEPVLAVG